MMVTKPKKIMLLTLASVMAFGLIGGVWGTTNRNAAAAESKPESKKIKNVIFMIGDGMGFSYTAAHRYMKDNPDTPLMEKTLFDKHLIGAQMTYPEDPKENITDSASAATAMSAGVKTYNNAVGVDNDESRVKTVLEHAKGKGMSTGLVATSEITHATPAAFGAHELSRKSMDQIADDYFDEWVYGKHKIDVMLGGGKSNFVRKDRDLTKEFQQDGYSYVTNREQMLKDDSEQVIGLFADGGMDKMIDRNAETPSLQEMTESAITRLDKNDEGFFLMVEGSQIDWAGHDNDVVAAMSEMEDFEQALESVLEFAEKDGETLVVMTADHSTGGFSLGSDGTYAFEVDPIKAAKRTPDFMAAQIAAGADVEETLAAYIDLELEQAEIDSVKKAAATKDVTAIDDEIEAIFNKRTHSGWTTGGHTGEDVPVIAYGPGKEQFAGLIDNIENAEKIFRIIDENHK